MLHTIANEFLRVTVSEQGAELQSILGPDGTEYLWQGDPAYWSDRAPNIFPYVARLTEGSYFMDGRRHQMNIHGIALYRHFQVTEHTADTLVMELTSDAETFAQYPRRFCFQIRYALMENTLDITFRVENQDSKPMYFGVGGHPGFRVPLAKGLAFEDYRLTFARACHPLRVGFTDDCFVTGYLTEFALEENRHLKLKHDLFDEDAIVLTAMDPEVTLCCDQDGHSVTVSYPDMPYLGIWHMPHTDAPYVCIEPWSSLPSRKDKVEVFEEQPGLLRLAAGCVYENTWRIRIR